MTFKRTLPALLLATTGFAAQFTVVPDVCQVADCVTTGSSFSGTVGNTGIVFGSGLVFDASGAIADGNDVNNLATL